MSRSIAFFDFDGTITTRDSLLEFIRFTKGRAAFYGGFALHAPVLIAYKLKLISNQLAKETMLRHFFGGMPLDRFQEHCNHFSQQVLPSLIRPKALREIRLLQDQGVEVVLVSASPEHWLRQWCEQTGLACIATRLVAEGGRLNGRIDGLNCYGAEKVTRIRQRYDLAEFSSIYCYGDTPGDKPMLALGTIRFYKPFR